MKQSSYLGGHINPNIPQNEPLDERQVENKAGGYAYPVDPFRMLERFLVIGTEGGTYYASERDITKENIDNLKYCIGEDGVRVVNTIKDISYSGRAPKQDPAIFALAYCFAFGDDDTKKAVEENYKQIARTGTTHLMFVSFSDQLGDSHNAPRWRSSLRRLVGSWYNRPEVSDKHEHGYGLAYQVLKYQNRGGWTHKDVLSKCHYGQNTALFRWITGKEYGERQLSWDTKDADSNSKTYNRSYAATQATLPELIVGYERIKRAETKNEVVKLISEYRLTHEMVPNQWKNFPDVWEALLQEMPMMALVRNLAKMTSIGLLTGLSDATQLIISKLDNVEALRKSRIHPISLLVALKTYSEGSGFRGSLKWNPVAQIKEALDRAFYNAVGNVKPINKPVIICLDVSGSMSGWYTTSKIMNCLSPAEVGAAMAMITARVETRYEIIAFDTKARPFTVTPTDSLPSIISNTESMIGGGTDCAAGILEARRRKLKADAFIVYTDDETWQGSVHPTQALRGYNREMGIEAKLCSVGMVATKTSIVDPDIDSMMDVVGFDTATPSIVRDFVSGEMEVAK